MSSSLSKWVAAVFLVLSAGTTLDAALASNQPVPRFVLFGAAALFATVSTASLMRLRAHENAVRCLHALTDQILPRPGFAVRRIETPAELRELWELDRVSYGDACPEFDTLREWWRAYPQGIYILLRNQEIIGAFGIWPLKRQAFKEILEGRRREREITAQSIERGAKVQGLSNWYISGIVLNSRFRRTEAVRLLLSQALSLWLQTPALAVPLRVTALGFSPEGANLLRRFGFRKYKDAVDSVENWPVFIREIPDLLELQELCERLLGSGRALAASQQPATLPAPGPAGP